METDDRTQLTMLYENMYRFMINKDTGNHVEISTTCRSHYFMIIWIKTA